MHHARRISCRRWGAGAAAFVCATLAATAGAQSADSNPALDDAVAHLAPAQHIRVLTGDYRTLRGHFIQSDGDSLFLRSLPAAAGGAQGRDAVPLSEVIFLWKTENYGVGRGLLWGGGTLLAGTALAFGAADNIDSELSGMVFLAVVGAATLYAFYEGTTGSKETLVYSQFRQ